MTYSTATAAFDAHAADYAALRRRLVPVFDDFYAAAIDALALATRPLARVLDLGAGTGLLAAMVRDAHPDARVTLLDGSPAMLDEARAVLGDDADYVVADLADAPPSGPWDAIVSALAIHHLDDHGKRRLFARAHAALAPGGVFVDAEQVAGATPRLDAADRAWHEAAARRRGASDAEWAAAVERMAHDRCAPVADQLGWLADAGFDDVDCPFRHHVFAVLVGRRA